MKKLLDSINAVSEWIGKVCSFLVIALTVYVVYQVIMRYIFNLPSM